LSIKPIEAYKKLNSTFGYQGWWPTTKIGNITPEYHKKSKQKVLSERERFEICLGAILTQNTAWKNVEKAIENLNRKKLIDLKKIAKILDKRLASLIRPSGYYNQKAGRLKDFAVYFAKNYNSRIGSFFTKPLSFARNELLSLKGIGPETADSMLLYAGNKLTFVVDAYTVRIGQRLGWFKDKNYCFIKSFFENNLPKSVELYKEYHSLLVALGKQHCKKKPNCIKCLLKAYCKN
jgi:endonuclease-3 related protein